MAKGIAEIATDLNRSLTTSLIDKRVSELSDNDKSVIQYAFDSLIAMKPAWRNAFKSKADVVEYKKQLGLAMIDSKINSLEKVNSGIELARKDASAFMPSTGLFVKWCKDRYGEKLVLQRQQNDHNNKKNGVLLIEQDTFEKRQAVAKSELNSIRKMLNKKEVFHE